MLILFILYKIISKKAIKKYEAEGSKRSIIYYFKVWRQVVRVVLNEVIYTKQMF